MEIVDTNIILRFFLKDDEKLSPLAAKLFIENTLFIPNEILAETIYVLEKIYLFNRKIIAQLFEELLQFDSIIFSNKELILSALLMYKKSSLSIIDSILFAYNAVEGFKIHTFDKALSKAVK